MGSVAALCLLVSVTFRLNDADFWQHLLVGKAIWQSHAIPRTHEWSWPTFGQPEVLPSWGFRALIWPFWSLGQVLGLYVWRWLSTLTVFAVAFLTARKLGARGLTTFLVFVVCGLIYRYRSQVRPETLANILLVTELWILERHRQDRVDHTIWLIPLAMVWINVHISYYLAFVLLAIYQLPWAGPWPVRRRLLRVSALSLLSCLVNPFGWTSLIQPIQYFFVWRVEPIYRSIAELHGIDWRFHARDGLAVMLVLWPLSILWRATRRTVDGVEACLCLLFTWLAVFNQRFIATWAIVAPVFLSRTLTALLASLRTPRVPRLGATAGAACACVLVCLPEWTRPDIRPGMGIDPLSTPVAACDFIEQHQIRGRFFNHFELGGYLLWRFWPQRDRLPFMDIHQSGTRYDRLIYEGSMSDPGIWQRAVSRYDLDVAILMRIHARGDRMLDFLDADKAWTMVFVDDVAAIYLRRRGPLLPAADRLAYRVVPGGMEGLRRLGLSIDQPGVRQAFRSELERVTTESAACSSALSLLATLDLQEHQYEQARQHLQRAHAIDPQLPMYVERMSQVDQARGR